MYDALFYSTILNKCGTKSLFNRLFTLKRLTSIPLSPSPSTHPIIIPMTSTDPNDAKSIQLSSSSMNVPEASTAHPPTTDPMHLYCRACEMWLRDQLQFDEHLPTKKHIKCTRKLANLAVNQ